MAMMGHEHTGACSKLVGRWVVVYLQNCEIQAEQVYQLQGHLTSLKLHSEARKASGVLLVSWREMHF